MSYVFNHLDHLALPNLAAISELLKAHNCHIAMIKKLPKNANDKNQVYFHSDASLLNARFDLRFSERGDSTSITKRASSPGQAIPQAVFHKFSWLSTTGTLHKAKECKAIIYSQYPEARFSAFQTTTGEIPRSISIDYAKSPELGTRYLVLGATPTGHAVAVMCVNPESDFEDEYRELEPFYGSKVCKAFTIEHGEASGSYKLQQILSSQVAGKTLKGCRYDKDGNTIPFNSTQVHGYTLEHACGIKPNSDKDGDIYGIELKCFTRKKLTLFTPEPDGGLYAASFPGFMKKYGYKSGSDYRVTGLHRAYAENPKTGLTLKIYCWMKNPKTKEPEKQTYNPEISISKQMTGMEVVLEDKDGNTAASWSLERLLNCWGAKHNEVVYYPATKYDNDVASEVAEGYQYKIEFANKVLWCKNTGAEQLFRAIHEGVVFLDPAPKYNEETPSRNKRRSQWRLNDIYKAASFLYETAEVKML
ncbi:MvaI/BcnI family restriction endonuclease [Photobacterium nomapromontoriensis]|uniref:MvaI/BcnI family restriction endonuclease n=1 Tax=Photobacterium nomapromontoriensis TaxID=2910237 RepID=UPI003D12D0E8